MNKILPIASLLLAAGALQAQATSMKVTDVITAQANKVTKSFTKGQIVKSMAVIVARDGRHMRGNAAATKMLRHGRSMRIRGSSYAMISDSASAKAGTNTASVSGKGVVAVGFRFAGKGTLTLTYYGRAINGRGGVKVTGGTTWAAAADGKRHSKKITIAKAGSLSLMVNSAVAAKATAKAGAHVGGSFSAIFVPGDHSGRKITITHGAASCKEGGALSGVASNRGMMSTITLSLKGSLPNGFAINLLSASPKTRLIPGSKTCNLFIAPHWAGMVRTDKSGNATTHLRHSFRRAATFYDQMVTLSFGRGGLKLASSNQLKIVVK